MVELSNKRILGMRVDKCSLDESVSKIIDWAETNQGRYICAANVHMVMEGYDNKEFRKIINNADLVTPDGMPLVWLLQTKQEKKQERVYGPDLMLELCKQAEALRIPVGLYGGKPETLNTLLVKLKEKFPNLIISYAYSPPFRDLSSEEEHLVNIDILKTKAKILFVGLGCPKQETWAAKNVNCLSIPLVSVGAAFDFHSEKIRQAPNFVRKLGLEWFYRLLQEPKRLLPRYLKHNPRFLLLLVQHWFKKKFN